jgi:hypothetical protein
MENTLVVTGECAGSIDEILPACEVLKRMAEEGEHLLHVIR